MQIPTRPNPQVQAELRALPEHRRKAAREILMDLASDKAEGSPYAGIHSAYRLEREDVVVFYLRAGVGVDVLHVRPNT
jgi:hypothetical protein